MNKFQNGIIYCIRCKTTNGLYIGSSIEPIKTRISKHKTDLKGYLGINKRYRCYRSSFEVLFNENYEVGIIEEYPCNNKRELEIRETLHILNNPECVNIRNPVKVNKEDHDLSTLPKLP